MKIKLEIISGELTPKQKGAIVEKLEEIRAIVKSESQINGKKIQSIRMPMPVGVQRLGMSLDEYLNQ